MNVTIFAFVLRKLYTRYMKKRYPHQEFRVHKK